jgi:phosphoglycolate phosphatase-like HAD superfamily hydrolase
MDALALHEDALVPTDALFRAGVEHVGRKLGRAQPLDVAALPSGRPATIAALDAWAAGAVDWRGELRRYYEEHIPVHVRPSAHLNGALRLLHGRGVRLVWVSPGPREASEVLLHHLGVARLVELGGEGEPLPEGITAVTDAGLLSEIAYRTEARA